MDHLRSDFPPKNSKKLSEADSNHCNSLVLFINFRHFEQFRLFYVLGPFEPSHNKYRNKKLTNHSNSFLWFHEPFVRHLVIMESEMSQYQWNATTKVPHRTFTLAFQLRWIEWMLNDWYSMIPKWLLTHGQRQQHQRQPLLPKWFATCFKIQQAQKIVLQLEHGLIKHEHRPASHLPEVFADGPGTAGPGTSIFTSGKATGCSA